MRRFLCAQVLLLWSIISFGQDAHALRRTFLDPTSPVVMVAAHRANHSRFPENSLRAIEESIRVGVDIVEIDVKVSADGVPFLMHDRTLDRTTNGRGDPEEFTWEQLQKFDVIDKGRTTKLKIPSLEQALEIAHGKILVDLDLKTEKVSEVIEVVRRTGMEEFVFFFDSDFEILYKVRSASNDYMIMPRAHSVSEADSAIALFDPPVVHIDFSFYSAESVNTIAMSSARVWINALGDCDDDVRRGKEKRALKRLLGHGANVIQTDEPERLLAALRNEGLHP